MTTAIVILNYNGKKLMQQFLPSVLQFSDTANIYVADNNSTDESIDYLKKNFPEIKIIQNDKNYGFAKGYNSALKDIDEDIICLLNNDVEVSKGWLDPIIEEFKNNTETSIIQPKILDKKNKTKFEYAGAAGGYLDKYGFPYCRGRVFDTVEKDKGQYQNTVEVLWASGACMFIRNSLWKELKGFDNKFFAHMEEIDLCWRAFNKGYRAKCIPASNVYHLGGATLSYNSPKKTYLNFRNNLYMLVKNLPKNVFSIVFTRLMLDGVASLRFLLQFKFAHFYAVLKAHLNFYYHLPNLLNQRYSIKTDRKYYRIKSVAWSYFVKGNKDFDCL